MFTLSSARVLTDNFGTPFQPVGVGGGGMCLYNSLSYCLSGSQSGYADIIDDCIRVNFCHNLLYCQFIMHLYAPICIMESSAVSKTVLQKSLVQWTLVNA